MVWVINLGRSGANQANLPIQRARRATNTRYPLWGCVAQPDEAITLCECTSNLLNHDGRAESGQRLTMILGDDLQDTMTIIMDAFPSSNGYLTT